MSENAVNKSITMDMQDNTREIPPEQNTFPLAIQELGEGLFENYLDKTSNITEENILGIIRCRALNDFMLEKYGVRYSVLDKICEDKMNLNISRNGFGIEKFIEIVKSIQATFEQTQLPSTLSQKMFGRR
jgi:hypothetical protein